GDPHLHGGLLGRIQFGEGEPGAIARVGTYPSCPGPTGPGRGLSHRRSFPPERRGPREARPREGNGRAPPRPDPVFAEDSERRAAIGHACPTSHVLVSVRYTVGYPRELAAGSSALGAPCLHSTRPRPSSAISSRGW